MSQNYEALQPLSWLVGRWKDVEACAFYPTMETLIYNDEIEFLHTGQPVLKYKSHAWHPAKKFAMHMEAGFLRLQPGNENVALMVSHNFGLTEISEGKIGNNELHLKSTSISRMSLAKDCFVTEIVRHFKLEGEKLHLVYLMSTPTQPLQEHIRATYQKIQEG